MFYSVDGFEEDRAILIGDDESRIITEKSKLPYGAKEGSILVFDEQKNSFALSPEEEEKRKAAIKSRVNSLFKRRKILK